MLKKLQSLSDGDVRWTTAATRTSNVCSVHLYKLLITGTSALHNKNKYDFKHLEVQRSSLLKKENICF